MKLADIADDVMIDARKLTHYALDPNSPYGKHKAILFERALGFTQDNYRLLVAQVESQIWQVELTFHSQDEFGARYTADLQIDGVQGKRALVRTGWLIAPDLHLAQRVTIYVKKR